MNPERFQSWVPLVAAVIGVGLASGSAYAAVELASTTLTLASYAVGSVGFGVYGLANADDARQFATGTTGGRDDDPVAGVTGVPFFCFIGANMLVWVPDIEQSWQPLFFVPAACIVLFGLFGVVASNRYVRDRLGLARGDAH